MLAASSTTDSKEQETAELLRRLQVLLSPEARVIFIDFKNTPTARLLREHGLTAWHLPPATIAAALRAAATPAMRVADDYPTSAKLATQCFRDRNGQLLYVDREQSAIKLLRLRFADFKTFVRSTQPLAPSAAASGGAPGLTRLIATHSARGGGKSHFLDALHELHGPSHLRSPWAKLVWSRFSARPLSPLDDPHDSARPVQAGMRVCDDPDFGQSEKYMQETVVVNCTFNDFQSGRSVDSRSSICRCVSCTGLEGLPACRLMRCRAHSLLCCTFSSQCIFWTRYGHALFLASV